MLDAYASSGLPIGYPHWSYGKAFIRNEQAYRKGYQGLAYEIVINSNPCIAYLMEENSMMMQALVIAHASYGHNSFFKGNYLFRQFTAGRRHPRLPGVRAALRDGVRGALRRGRSGRGARFLPCADGLRRGPLQAAGAAVGQGERGAQERASTSTSGASSTICGARCRQVGASRRCRDSGRFPAEPEENILYFVEKHSPRLAPWQRELVRIVRKLAQYFYPQTQTKVMNEGWATFWHYTLINRLYEKRLVNDAFMIEFLHNHTNVVTQRGFDEHGYHGINPYALGFAMMQDIRRICEQPTEEDRRLVPGAGADATGASRWTSPCATSRTNPSSRSTCRRA